MNHFVQIAVLVFAFGITDASIAAPPARRSTAPPAPRSAAPAQAQPQSSASISVTNEEQAVDLSKITAPQSQATQQNPHHRSGPKSERLFKVFFDLSLYSLSGVQELTFANFHSFLFLDIIPSQDIQFAFDVSNRLGGGPTFYELDWRISPMVQLRLGKIWIPFDDLSPHSQFGGRTTVSLLDPPGSRYFLPDIWTDLGVGARFDLVDSQDLQLITHLYVVNGFESGGNDPATPGSPYPDFADHLVTNVDNNMDKSIGGRVQAKLGGGKLGIGASAFSGRWNDRSDPEAKRLLILGADTQLRLKIAWIRAGATTMKVNLPTDKMTRGGFYGEFGVPVGNWQFITRAGSRQLDDRRLLTEDRTIVGGALLFKPNFIQWSAEYSKDIKKREGKTAEEYFAVRSIIEL